MKGCIAAALLLAVMLVGVRINAAYICQTSDTLRNGLGALPDELSAPDSTDGNSEEGRNQDLADSVAELHETLETRAKILRLTVPSGELDEIRNALIFLESYARAGAQTEYAATRRLLLELCKDLADFEKLDLPNLL